MAKAPYKTEKKKTRAISLSLEQDEKLARIKEEKKLLNISQVVQWLIDNYK